MAGDTDSKESDDARSSQDRIDSYEKQLRRLASELSLTEARERREIASDLHDHVGQALAYVSQRLAVLQGNSIFSGMEADFSEILSILDQTIRYTRNLTVEISPPVLYELGLPAAIDWLVERASERFDLHVTSSQSGTPTEIAEDVKVFMFKATQELIFNAAKHANATRIEIRAEWKDPELVITVSDNGDGFKKEMLENGLADGCCFGLFSIRERLSYIGGRLLITSKPGAGTDVSVTAPYSTAAADGDN
jgi:signal transduction histidine kinase